MTTKKPGNLIRLPGFSMESDRRQTVSGESDTA